MMKNVKERGVKEDSTGEKDGASIPAPKSSTTLKRPSTQSKVSSTLRKDLENKNKGSFNKTDQGGKLSANITRLSQTINSKNPKLRASSKKEYAAATNSYNKAFNKYEKEANSKMSITADSKTDRAIQKKTKSDAKRININKEALEILVNIGEEGHLSLTRLRKAILNQCNWRVMVK